MNIDKNARTTPREAPAPVQRYQWVRSGDLLHLDVKKLGRIGRVGHRISGDRRSRVRDIGWEYVHWDAGCCSCARRED